MPEKKEAVSLHPKTSYFQEIIGFYFAPRFRSVATVLYLMVFSYFALYYVDNIFLAFKFLIYLIFQGTVLEGTSHLFTGMIFVLALTLPFLVSLYAIFVLYDIWTRHFWKNPIKWVVTALVALTSLFIVLISDEIARTTASTQYLQSFIEDQNLRGRL